MQLSLGFIIELLNHNIWEKMNSRKSIENHLFYCFDYAKFLVFFLLFKTIKGKAPYSHTSSLLCNNTTLHLKRRMSYLTKLRQNPTYWYQWWNGYVFIPHLIFTNEKVFTPLSSHLNNRPQSCSYWSKKIPTELIGNGE